MAAFRFTLEPVLELRRKEERRCQRTVAELERERLEIEGEIRDCRVRLDEERDVMREQLASGGGGRVRLPEVRMQANASLHLVSRAQRSAIRLAGVLRRLEGARRELLVATTRRKAVERLRERRHAEWLDAQARREAADIDEMAVIRHAREDV